jgi:hypothetical protein
VEDLPRGAFVCEYVGEILTSAELHERAIENARNGKHMHQVLLDAGWGSGVVLRDEDACSLDGSFYGNVGRFINHRYVGYLLVFFCCKYLAIICVLQSFVCYSAMFLVTNICYD